MTDQTPILSEPRPVPPNQAAFDVWAPVGVEWSAWAKPALFAGLDRARLMEQSLGDWRTTDVSWAPSPRRRVAIVVDLPNVRAVQMGMALAAIGYRPVPLFNVTVGRDPIIRIDPLADALGEAVAPLAELRIPLDAPPAFLLDSRRMSPEAPLLPGKFDNRWIVLPQDFPSGNRLLARGIGEVLLVQATDDAPREDLAHVLLRWQRAGVRLQLLNVTGNRQPAPITVRPPTLFRRAWYLLLALSSLRRSSAGGFGGMIPLPSEGGSSFG